MLQDYLHQSVAFADYSPMTAGERFAELRKSKGFGQRSLAVAAGIKSAQTVSDFEVGKSNRMQPDNWRAIAEAFGMEVQALNEAVFGETVQLEVPVPLADYVRKLVDKYKLRTAAEVEKNIAASKKKK